MWDWLLKKARAPRREPVRIAEGSGRTIPTVKFDASQVTDAIREGIAQTLRTLPEIAPQHFDAIYEASLLSVSSGRDAFVLSQALLAIGVSRTRAGQIARLINNRATGQMNVSRQQSLGITHAIWRAPGGAPCGDPEMTALHQSLDGKRYEIAKGILVGKRRIYPGTEEGCRCTSTSVIPGLNR